MTSVDRSEATIAGAQRPIQGSGARQANPNEEGPQFTGVEKSAQKCPRVMTELDEITSSFCGDSFVERDKTPCISACIDFEILRCTFVPT